MSYTAINIDKQEFIKSLDETINIIRDNDFNISKITLYLCREKSNEKFNIDVPFDFLVKSYEDLRQPLMENIDKILLEMNQYKVALDEIELELVKDENTIKIPFITSLLEFCKERMKEKEIIDEIN